MIEVETAKDPDLFMETPDGTGQWVGALKAGMLGLCGEESRQRALADLEARKEVERDADVGS